MPSSPTILYLQRGDLSILSALAAELPDVFTAEILPKLEVKDILNLAQVSKWCRDVVWSVGGVRSLEAKLKVHAESILPGPSVHGWAMQQVLATYPRSRPSWSLGWTLTKRAHRQNTSQDTWRLFISPLRCSPMIVKLLIDAGVDVNKRATMSDFTKSRS